MTLTDPSGVLRSVRQRRHAAAAFRGLLGWWNWGDERHFSGNCP